MKGVDCLEVQKKVIGDRKKGEVIGTLLVCLSYMLLHGRDIHKMVVLAWSEGEVLAL